jgi:hypothetical protein
VVGWPLIAALRLPLYSAICPIAGPESAQFGSVDITNSTVVYPEKLKNKIATRSITAHYTNALLESLLLLSSG